MDAPDPIPQPRRSLFRLITYPLLIATKILLLLTALLALGLWIAAHGRTLGKQHLTVQLRDIPDPKLVPPPARSFMDLIGAALADELSTPKPRLCFSQMGIACRDGKFWTFRAVGWVSSDANDPAPRSWQAFLQQPAGWTRSPINLLPPENAGAERWAGINFDREVYSTAQVGEIRWDLTVPLWEIAAIASAWPAISFVLFVRRLRRGRLAWESTHCTTCGYDLRATPTRCPECGTPRKINP